MILSGVVPFRDEQDILHQYIDAFVEEAPESCLPLPPYEDAEKVPTIYEPGNNLSMGTESANTLILDFPDTRTLRNKCLFFM